MQQGYRPASVRYEAGRLLQCPDDRFAGAGVGVSFPADGCQFPGAGVWSAVNYFVQVPKPKKTGFFFKFLLFIGVLVFFFSITLSFGPYCCLISVVFFLVSARFFCQQRSTSCSRNKVANDFHFLSLIVPLSFIQFNFLFQPSYPLTLPRFTKCYLPYSFLQNSLAQGDNISIKILLIKYCALFKGKRNCSWNGTQSEMIKFPSFT